MKWLHDRRRRLPISTSCLLGFALTLSSASLLSGCGDDKSEMKMVEQKDDPAVIAKDSMNFYKTQKGAAPKKK
jgi:hypothetical protein